MVEIITSSISHKDLQDKINEWNISNKNIVSITISITPMYDLYQPIGGISNQWIDYTAIIIY